RGSSLRERAGESVVRAQAPRAGCVGRMDARRSLREERPIAPLRDRGPWRPLGREARGDGSRCPPLERRREGGSRSRGRAGCADPPAAGPPAALRYTVEGRSLDEFDPDHLAAEASWRAAASIGGEPIAARSAVVALEPRAAAAFLRSLVPLFVRTAGSPHARS